MVSSINLSKAFSGWASVILIENLIPVSWEVRISAVKILLQVAMQKKAEPNARISLQPLKEFQIVVWYNQYTFKKANTIEQMLNRFETKTTATLYCNIKLTAWVEIMLCCICIRIMKIFLRIWFNNRVLASVLYWTNWYWL